MPISSGIIVATMAYIIAREWRLLIELWYGDATDAEIDRQCRVAVYLTVCLIVMTELYLWLRHKVEHGI
jgi:hypothetical protein